MGTSRTTRIAPSRCRTAALPRGWRHRRPLPQRWAPAQRLQLAARHRQLALLPRRLHGRPQLLPSWRLRPAAGRRRRWRSGRAAAGAVAAVAHGAGPSSLQPPVAAGTVQNSHQSGGGLRKTHQKMLSIHTNNGPVIHAGKRARMRNMHRCTMSTVVKAKLACYWPFSPAAWLPSACAPPPHALPLLPSPRLRLFPAPLAADAIQIVRYHRSNLDQYPELWQESITALSLGKGHCLGVHCSCQILPGANGPTLRLSRISSCLFSRSSRSFLSASSLACLLSRDNNSISAYHH